MFSGVMVRGAPDGCPLERLVLYFPGILLLLVMTWSILHPSLSSIPELPVFSSRGGIDQCGGGRGGVLPLNL